MRNAVGSPDVLGQDHNWRNSSRVARYGQRGLQAADQKVVSI